MVKDILDAISSQIRRAPEAAALQTGGRIYSFGALGRRVQGIHDALAETAGRGLVLIAGHKEADAVAAMLACMFLGRAFAFIDCSNPSGRAADILRLSQADLVLAAGTGAAIPGARSLALSQIMDRPFDLRPAPVPDSDLLYVVFTSGSTGTPKGVPCGRGNVAAFDAWYRQMLADLPGQELDPAQSAHVNHASLAFDMGMLDLWPVLALGRPVILLDHGDNVIPRNNIKALARSDLVQARSWFSTPSLLQIMAMEPKFNGDTLPAMRCFFVGGEIVPRELLQTLAARFPRAEIRHAYGPTETTCLSHVHRLTAADLAAPGLLPLGPALGAFEMRILDEDRSRRCPGRGRRSRPERAPAGAWLSAGGSPREPRVCQPGRCCDLSHRRFRQMRYRRHLS